MDYSQHHSYRELLDYLEHLYEGDLDKIFHVILRLNRGLRTVDSDRVFFKDSVYLNGYHLVRNYLEHEGDVQPLYIGKIHKDDIGIFTAQGYTWSDEMKLPLFVS